MYICIASPPGERTLCSTEAILAKLKAKVDNCKGNVEDSGLLDGVQLQVDLEPNKVEEITEALTISDVARRTGLRPSAIRYYESIGLLPEPFRVSGRRRYEQNILERISFIQIAQKLGFSLNEILMLVSEQKADTPLSKLWQSLAQQKLGEVNALIQQAHGIRQLLVQGLNCACSDLEDCIDCVLMQCQ